MTTTTPIEQKERDVSQVFVSEVRIARASLKSASPYSQSRAYQVPRESENEGDDAYERRTWRNRMHVAEDGRVMIPNMAFKNAIAEAAKFYSRKKPGKGKETWTKHFEAGIIVPNPLILDVLAESIEGETLFVPANGQRGGGRRVYKVFPVIPSWEGELQFIVTDSTITEEIFRFYLSAAGMYIGIGRWRVRNLGCYGQFRVAGIEWAKMEL